MSAGRLEPVERTRAINRLSEETVDVLVVGGGVVGAGAALDAASRGLTVGLLERRDWASGTSSRSSRLAHGGLRYLEQLEFGLVHQALTERGLLLDRLAPHLVRPVPFMLPLTHRGWERPYVGTGVALYDVLSRMSRKGGALPSHRHLSRKATARLGPGLAPEAYTGAIGFFDAQIDDARHTLAVVRSAVAHGALAASRVEVTAYLREGERVVGVEALDHESGRRIQVRARVVAGATGVWSVDTAGMLGEEATAKKVLPSKGVHVIVPRNAIALHTALIARTRSSVLFLLPWGQTWLVGTTDTPWDGDRDEPGVTAEDVDYLLAEANRWLVRPLTRQDVVSVYAGLRPLLADPEGSTETAKLSREHAVTRPAPGLVEIAGGKYTTYRVMARDLVDVAASDLPFAVPASRTEEVLLVGAEGFAARWESRLDEAADLGVDEPQIRRLLRRYGADVGEVFEAASDDPRSMEPIHPEAPVLRAEIRYAASHEGALRLEDVLLRRTRLAFITRDGARSVAGEVAGVVAPLLGWDEQRCGEEVEAFAEVSPRVPGAVAP
jgi:glycerol-3-phosphate dehydrogenase